MVEGIGAPLVLGESTLEAREGAVQVSACRQQQPAAAGEDRERPGPVERGRAWLPLREDSLRLVEPVRRDQRLQQIAELQPHARLQEVVAAQHTIVQDHLAKNPKPLTIETVAGDGPMVLEEGSLPRRAALGSGCVDTVSGLDARLI